MNNENRNDEAVSPVIATILMVAITVVLAGVLYVWASSLADDSTGGGLDKYQFSSRDAADTMSDAAGEKLVHIKMTNGDGLSWSVLKVSIVVDGGNNLVCVDASKDDGTADCTYTTDEDSSWSVPEEITISEGDVDLCDGADGGCDVDVTLTKIGVGNEEDKVIREVTAYADANN
jgi:flagellin-like protein